LARNHTLTLTLSRAAGEGNRASLRGELFAQADAIAARLARLDLVKTSHERLDLCRRSHERLDLVQTEPRASTDYANVDLVRTS
jgi:hypothetical protein